jgi:hypothetical protein
MIKLISFFALTIILSGCCGFNYPCFYSEPYYYKHNQRHVQKRVIIKEYYRYPRY